MTSTHMSVGQFIDRNPLRMAGSAIVCGAPKETRKSLVPLMTPLYINVQETPLLCCEEEVPSAIAERLAHCWAIALVDQYKFDCISFTNDLLRHHPLRAAVEREPDMCLKTGANLIKSIVITPQSVVITPHSVVITPHPVVITPRHGTTSPFGRAIEFLMCREIKNASGENERQVRVCHSAIFAGYNGSGDALYLSKLGLMSVYPLLTYDEMIHYYPEATRVRLVRLSTRCFGCDSTSKPTTRCSRCLNVQYCSTKCQVSRWKYHKSACHTPLSLANSTLKRLHRFITDS
jgi:hypothetical protein